MNQKNYSFLLYSLLIASYSVYGVSEIDDMLRNPFVENREEDDIDPMQRENTASPNELQQDQDNYEWAQKYASKIVTYFFTEGYKRITEKELENYFKTHPELATKSLYVNRSFALGVVNGLLEKMELEHNIGIIANSFSEDKELSNIKDFDTVVARAMKLFLKFKPKVVKQLEQLPSEEKDKILSEINAVLQNQPVDKSSKQFNDNVRHVVDSFKKEGREAITGFSEILKRAKDLKLSGYFISQLEKLSEREKGNLFLMVDMMLPTKVEVANALELARAAHIEDQKEQARDRERDVRRKQEKQKEVARALDLANSVKKEEIFEASEEEDIKFHNFSISRSFSKKQLENALNLSREISKNEESNEGMRAPQNSMEDQDFDNNDEKLSGGLFGLDDEDTSASTVKNKYRNADEQQDDDGGSDLHEILDGSFESND